MADEPQDYDNTHSRELTFTHRSCGTCVMWVRHEGKIGHCIRFPPVPDPSGSGFSFWPHVAGDQVCGEHTAGGSGRIEQVRR